jgi:hypothetical protein
MFSRLIGSRYTESFNDLIFDPFQDYNCNGQLKRKISEIKKVQGPINFINGTLNFFVYIIRAVKIPPI